VLVGEEEGRLSDDEITVFDSTGLAVQDLAVAVAVYVRWRGEPSSEAFAGVTELELG
jgi:ornithine cyclodeaminase/alanine dehydrogenase-like protein (mu-crystallin family)